MKWTTLQGPTDEHKGNISIGEIATIEALRGIAEQMERVAIAFEGFVAIFERANEDVDEEVDAERSRG